MGKCIFSQLRTVSWEPNGCHVQLSPPKLSGTLIAMVAQKRGTDTAVFWTISWSSDCGDHQMSPLEEKYLEERYFADRISSPRENSYIVCYILSSIATLSTDRIRLFGSCCLWSPHVLSSCSATLMCCGSDKTGDYPEGFLRIKAGDPGT